MKKRKKLFTLRIIVVNGLRCVLIRNFIIFTFRKLRFFIKIFLLRLRCDNITVVVIKNVKEIFTLSILDEFLTFMDRIEP